MTEIERIVLVGLSGGGKTTVGQELAARLGWSCVDTDAEIEAEFGRTIPEIFAAEGEPAFRAAERRLLGRALERTQVIVPTGAGAVVDRQVWESPLLGRPGTLVVALEVQPEVALRRLRDQEAAAGAAVGRPMLAGDDPLARIAGLKAARQSCYDRAAVTLVVDAVRPDHVAAEIVGLLPGHRSAEATVVHLAAPSGRSEIRIEPGLLARLGELTGTRWPKARRAWVVSDERVAGLHGQTAVAALEQAGFENRGGKGSHRNYVHPRLSKPVTISGKLGDDAKQYQVRAVNSAIAELEK